MCTEFTSGTPRSIYDADSLRRGIQISVEGQGRPENTICSKPQSAWLPAHASLALPVLQRFMRFKTSTLLFLRPCRLPYVAFRSNKVWNRGNKDPAWTSHVDVCIDITGATMAASRQQVFLSAQMAIYLSAQMAKKCSCRMGLLPPQMGTVRNPYMRFDQMPCPSNPVILSLTCSMELRQRRPCMEHHMWRSASSSQVPPWLQACSKCSSLRRWQYTFLPRWQKIV